MSEIEFDDLDMEEVKELLASNMIEISRLKKKVAAAEESAYRSAECMRKQKSQAGFSDNTSFDVVWAKTLEKAQKWDAYQAEPRHESHQG